MPDDPLGALLERLDRNGLSYFDASYLHEAIGLTEAQLRNPPRGEVPWSWIAALVQCRVDVLRLSLAELHRLQPFERWTDKVRFAREHAELRAWRQREFSKRFFSTPPESRERSLRRRFYDYQLRTGKRLIRRGFNGYLDPRAGYAAQLRERAARIERGEPEFTETEHKTWSEIRAGAKPELGLSNSAQRPH